MVHGSTVTAIVHPGSRHPSPNARAAARNCATQLARTLEDYRRGSLEKQYPAAGDIALPPPCQNQTVRWQTRTAQAYAFSVVGEDGQVLAGGEGPYTDSD